jgi:hypothetical protein
MGRTLRLATVLEMTNSAHTDRPQKITFGELRAFRRNLAP